VPTEIEEPVRAIAALATATFVYVTAETMPVGLLPQISHGLSVRPADVGLLLTSYATVAAVSTIPLTSLTMRIPRNRLIVGLVIVFSISQATAALAPTFTILLVTRLLCALAHGVFWSAITPAAARLGPPGQAGRIISLVFIGNTAALVAGVPLATALGQLAGWRFAFAAVAVAGAVSAVALALVLPDMPALPADLALSLGPRLRSATRVIGSPAIAAVCVVTTVVVIGQFAAFTYIAPLVRRNGNLDGFALSALLFGNGAAGISANILLGRIVDRRPGTVLLGSILATSAALLALTLTRGSAATTIAVLVWGAGFSAVPLCLQAAVLRVAPNARDSASAVYVVSFQIGISAGALIGDLLVGDGHLAALPILGAAVVAAAAVIVLGSRKAFPMQLNT
jgi:predicted MFS family arabinose efflux permease